MACQAPLKPRPLTARQKLKIQKKSGKSAGGAPLKSIYEYSEDLWAGAACGDIAVILSTLRHGADVNAKQKKVHLKPQKPPIILSDHCEKKRVEPPRECTLTLSLSHPCDSNPAMFRIITRE